MEGNVFWLKHLLHKIHDLNKLYIKFLMIKTEEKGVALCDSSFKRLVRDKNVKKENGCPRMAHWFFFFSLLYFAALYFCVCAIVSKLPYSSREERQLEFTRVVLGVILSWKAALCSRGSCCGVSSYLSCTQLKWEMHQLMQENGALTGWVCLKQIWSVECAHKSLASHQWQLWSYSDRRL